ncbi:protein BCAP isoform X2 [Monodelphis domestica]|uniref:protein BCAP isoform X2 n=1 Tax=Monodelphis domestica TaxID=13616 RepID=UPI0024E26530|nr:protein BCAP isoform X2 [Monodelphis domestica]
MLQRFHEVAALPSCYFLFSPSALTSRVVPSRPLESRGGLMQGPPGQRSPLLGGAGAAAISSQSFLAYEAFLKIDSWTREESIGMPVPLFQPEKSDPSCFKNQGQTFHPDFFQFSACLEKELPAPDPDSFIGFMDKPEKHENLSEELSSHHSSKTQENHQPWSSSENEVNWLKQDALNEETELEKKLEEAELAANSVVSLIPLFKDSLAGFNENMSSSVEILMAKLADNESENNALKKKVLEKEDYIQELSSFIQKEKANTLKTTQLSHSVKSVQSHLQLQIQKKEAENDQLKSHIKSLKAKIVEWKLQLKTYEQQLVTLKQTNEQKKIALKKATKVCKERADSYMATRLSEALSASLAWKSHYEKAVEEKTDLEVQVETLKKKIMNLLEEQNKKEDPGRNSSKDFLKKLHSSELENENILLENEKLKIMLAALEEKVISVENERLELQDVEKKQKALVEVYKAQVQKLQKAVEDVKNRYEKLVSEKKLITQTKKSTLEEVRDQMESHSKELEHVHSLLEGAELELRDCQERLIYCKGKFTDQSQTVQDLQSQIDDNQSLLKTFSLEEENSPKSKCENLKQKLEMMDAENEKLERKVASQEEYLKKNKFKFKEKSAEYNALARQLEVALEEGKQKVSEEIEKMTSREQALQIKILDLESELRKKNEEQNQLVSIFSTREQHQEICLKEIQHNLEKTENQNDGILNYVQFLKNSYVSIFG